MNPLAAPYQAPFQDVPEYQLSSHDHARTNSAHSTAGTNLQADSSCASSVASAQSTSRTDISTLHASDIHRCPPLGMMTRYHYDESGKLIGSTNGPENGRDIVATFLAQHRVPQPGSSVFDGYVDDGNIHGAYSQQYNAYDNDQVYLPPYCWSSGGVLPPRYETPPHPYQANPFSHTNLPMYSEHRFPYPDPDSIRHFHTLHSFLPHLQPERKLGALDGPTIDIVEQHSGTIYIQNVPKKMLVLFLGRQTVNKFLRTIERVDNVNWRGGPTRQELRLPRGCASSSALEILIVWMRRACQHQTMGDMKQFLVPVNLFAACSLGSTLELFGLRKDALRVEMFIGKNHFQRPIFAVEMKALWSCLGETSRYTYGAIKVLGQRFRAYENGTEKKLLRDFDQILELLEAFPLLGARVRDGCLNERYAPTFGTKWFSKISDGV